MDQNSSNANKMMSTQPLGQPPDEQPPEGQPPSAGSYAPQPPWTPPVYPPAGPPPQNQGQPGAQPSYPPPGSQPPTFGQPPPAQGQGLTQPVYPPPPGYGPASPPPSAYPPPPGYPQPGYPPGAPYPPPPGYTAPQQKSGVPIWLGVTFGLVLVIILACVFVVLGLGALGREVGKSFSQLGTNLESGSYTTVLNFYSYMDAEEYTAAYSLLGGNAALNYTPDSLRSSWLALTRARGQVIPNPIFASVNEKGSSATVDQPITTSKGLNYNVHLKLTKSGGTWLITDATPALIPK
jgi:hypothetical protein